MLDTNERRNEYARLYKENESLIHFVDTQSRARTADEQSRIDANFVKMDEIKRQSEEQLRNVGAAFTSGQFAPEMSKGEKEFHAQQGRFTRNSVDPFKPLKPSEKFMDALGVQAPNFGLGDFVRATVLGARNEAERFAVQSGTDNAGSFVLPDALAAQTFDSTRTRSAVISSGALTIPLTTYGGRVLGLSDVVTPVQRSENSAVAVSQTATATNLAPKSLAVIVKIAREYLEDAVNGNQFVADAFSNGFANALDAALVAGIVATSGVLDVHAHDTLTNYEYLLQALYQLQLKGFVPSGAVMSPREMLAVNSFADTLGQFLRPPTALASVPFFSSPSIPTNGGAYADEGSLILGEFSQLVVGLRTELRLTILADRFMDSNQYAFLCDLRYDFGLQNPKAFCVVDGILPA